MSFPFLNVIPAKAGIQKLFVQIPDQVGNDNGLLAFIFLLLYTIFMRYPWVCLSIGGVWTATILVVVFKIVEPTTLYLYASATALVLFFLGFARN